MGLAETLSTPPSAKSNRCGTCKWIRELPDEDRAAVETAMKNPAWGQAALHRTLVANGLPIGETQFRRHYRGICSE